MNIKVIGSGCENCDKTNAIVAECVEEQEWADWARKVIVQNSAL